MREPSPNRRPHPDLAWLGLERHGGGRWSFELTPPLSRLDGRFYGGTGVAVAAATMEAETGRDVLWVTVQYAATAAVGERLDCRVEVLAHGRRASQVRLTASVGDRLVLSAAGSTGEPRAGLLDAQFGDMPVVGGPEDSPRWGRSAPFPVPPGDPGWLAITDLRETERDGSRMALWARMRDMRQTRATLGFLGDMVPMGVMRAAGRAGGGTSLDNAIRFGPPPDTDWILVDLEPHMASGGYLHGAARLWSTDGTLLAVASQTARAVFFD